MAELERELRAVGEWVEWPPEPDLGARVRARVRQEPAARVFPWRRALVVALAVVIVAIAAVLAVPSARTAILRWLGLEHVRVVRVQQLPETRRLAATDLGTRTTLDDAARRVGFTPLLPRGREPTSVYARVVGPITRVTLVYGSVARPRLLLTEFRGTGTDTFVEKLAGPGTTIERVRVRGDPGLWISGKPHAVYYEVPGATLRQIYPSEPLLAGNTLVWERGQRTLRLEGKLRKSEALALAKSVE
jgi:hypothetical protein